MQLASAVGVQNLVLEYDSKIVVEQFMAMDEDMLTYGSLVEEVKGFAPKQKRSLGQSGCDDRLMASPMF